MKTSLSFFMWNLKKHTKQNNFCKRNFLIWWLAQKKTKWLLCDQLRAKLSLFSKGNLALWVALSWCMCLCVYVCVKQIFGDVARCRTWSYGAVRLVLIAPFNCWRNSTPFWCKTSFCMIKIGNFRTYHGPSLFDPSRSCFWYMKVSETWLMGNPVLRCVWPGTGGDPRLQFSPWQRSVNVVIVWLVTRQVVLVTE